MFFLAILTGFRDVNQDLALDSTVSTDQPPDCETWAWRQAGWDSLARCVQWGGCDDAQVRVAGDSKADTTGLASSTASKCRRLRCLCM